MSDSLTTTSATTSTPAAGPFGKVLFSTDADRVGGLICAGNARRVYALP